MIKMELILEGSLLNKTCKSPSVQDESFLMNILGPFSQMHNTSM